MKSLWATFSWLFQELGAFSLQWPLQGHSQTCIQPWLFLERDKKKLKSMKAPIDKVKTVTNYQPDLSILRSLSSRSSDSLSSEAFLV